MPKVGLVYPVTQQVQPRYISELLLRRCEPLKKLSCHGYKNSRVRKFTDPVNFHPWSLPLFDRLGSGVQLKAEPPIGAKYDDFYRQ